MLNWEQTDQLNAIATNPEVSPERKKSDIQDLMRKWSESVNYRGCYATNAALWDLDDTIDIHTQSGVKVPIPGQNGRYYHPTR